jgi:hypothetical protein
MPNYVENIFWKFSRRIWKVVLRLPTILVLFSLWKKEDPPTLLQTNTTCTIGFIDSIHKKEVETPLAFELSLVGITGVSVDFTPINITPTTNQVFSNPFTLTHTTHSSYTARSEFNCLDDKFYYDSDIDWIFDSRATKHICWNVMHSNFRTINKTIKSSLK